MAFIANVQMISQEESEREVDSLEESEVLILIRLCGPVATIQTDASAAASPSAMLLLAVVVPTLSPALPLLLTATSTA